MPYFIGNIALDTYDGLFGLYNPSSMQSQKNIDLCD